MSERTDDAGIVLADLDEIKDALADVVILLNRLVLAVERLNRPIPTRSNPRPRANR